MRVRLTLPVRPPVAASRSAVPEREAEYKLGTRPLPARTARVPRAPEVPVDVPHRPGSEPSPEFDVRDDGARIEGRRRDLDARVLARFQRTTSPTRLLDLHGETVESARRAVAAAVRRAATEGARVLLVVHGKGVHSPFGYGAIRLEISGWLTAEPCASLVLGFVSARAEHGGEGALYVLLGRRYERVP